MATTRVTLDFYNSSLGIDVDGISHVFSTPAKFLELTNFPRGEANIISFELERNLFFVEYVGGITIAGDQTPEIKWISNNLELLKQAAIQDLETYASPPVANRRDRDAKLYTSDWMIIRHQDELLLGTPTTLSTEQLQQLLLYRQQLRNIASDMLSSTDADCITWPTPPSFLA